MGVTAKTFWDLIEVGLEDECWPWLGRLHHNYGVLHWHGEDRLSHRVSYALFHGVKIADLKGICVLHSCDNPPCCNPYHLFEGTRVDNVEDMDMKGRRGASRGVEQHSAKLTDKKVLKIKRMFASGKYLKRELGSMFGCNTRKHRSHHTRKNLEAFGEGMITKPMLAGKVEDFSKIQFPVLATPKLDGIRCLKINGKAVSRSFKPIANVFVREWIEKHIPNGMDGELMVEGVPFSEIAGFIGSHYGKPNFRFYCFDYVTQGLRQPYSSRAANLADFPTIDRLVKVLPVTIRNEKELNAFEEKCLADGYEGVMIRTPNSPYKCGRSTEREGYLLKIKRMDDSEAVILECIEGQSNRNEATEDNFGRTKRSSHKANKFPKNTLGAFRVRDLKTGVEFNISGFTAAFAASVWANQKKYVGTIVKYKYQAVGSKTAPRFPKFVGFREKWDM